MAEMDYSKLSPFSFTEGQFLSSANLVPYTYNVTDSSMEVIRAKVARAQAGFTHNIILMGHSYFAGSNATPGSTDFGTALKKSLKLKMGTENVDSGIVILKNGEVYDSRYSAVAAGWGLPNSGPFGSANTAGAALTFTSDNAGTIVQIATYENSAAFTYSIDGAAAVTVNPLSGNIVTRLIEITGLPNTTHSVVFTATTTSNTYLIGIGVVNPAGLRVINPGFGGTNAYDWNDMTSPTRRRKMMQGLFPNRDIILLQMDTNDLRNGQTVSQWRNSMSSIISDEKSYGAGIVLITSVDAPGNGVPPLSSDQWNSYYDVATYLAETYNIPVLSQKNVLGGWSRAVANGLNGDTLHPNAAGYKLTAKAVADLLTS